MQPGLFRTKFISPRGGMNEMADLRFLANMEPGDVDDYIDLL